MRALEVTKLPLRGEAQFTFLFMSIYEAKLWSENINDLYQGKLGLALTYKREFKGEQIVAQTQRELIHAGVSKSKAASRCEELNSVFPDVGPGDSLLADFNPKEGITFYLNFKKKVGVITDLEFAKAFLDIWLGPKTSEQRMRRQLLGEVKA